MKTSLTVAVVVALAGCATPTNRTTDPRALATAAATAASSPAGDAGAELADFTYRLLTPEQTGLTQVFDDGHETYLKFASAVPAGLMLFDESGKPVPYTIAGDAVVAHAVHDGVLVRTPTQSSYAQPRSLEHATRVAAGRPDAPNAAPWLPADLAAARAEMLRARQRIDGLSDELDKTARGEPARPLAQIRSEIEELQTTLNGVVATLVRAHFASGSALLALSDDTRQAIIGAARQADDIVIRGRTDATGTAQGNAHLALRRAQAMQRMLIQGGIPAVRLHFDYQTGDFIASNATAEGRAQNRLVDLLFANHNGEAIRMSDTAHVTRSTLRAAAH